MHRAVILSGILLITALAGCASDDPTPDDAAGPGTQDKSPDAGLTAESVVDPPEWGVADWFGHHVFLGPEDDQGIHINTVVLEEDSSGYYLVTDNEEIAKIHAAFDLPLLGDIDPDLSAEAFGEDWDVYDWPLRDGKTWTGDFGTGPITYNATFDAAIPTPYGDKAGFRIAGVDGDGTLAVETDYVPEIGWYSELIIYATWTEEPDDFDVHIISMGFGEDWSGDYFDYEATTLLQYDHFFHPLDPATATPGHQETLAVAETADLVVGYLYSFAVAGESVTGLVAPDGRHWEFPSVHAPAGADPNAWGSESDGTPQDSLWEAEAAAGDWQFYVENAAFVGGGGAGLWALDDVSGSL